jgi:hypothetical protein
VATTAFSNQRSSCSGSFCARIRSRSSSSPWAGYLGNSFTFFLLPSHAGGALSAVYLVPSTLAEVSFLIWLLVKGMRGKP